MFQLANGSAAGTNAWVVSQQHIKNPAKGALEQSNKPPGRVLLSRLTLTAPALKPQICGSKEMRGSGSVVALVYLSQGEPGKFTAKLLQQMARFFFG